MEKIGMVRDAAGDFLHPAIPPDHKLAPHVLYRIERDGWKRNGRP
jgi:ribosomal-protein-alanine N-acetyltransferase